jgi:hypothetical protein
MNTLTHLFSQNFTTIIRHLTPVLMILLASFCEISASAFQQEEVIGYSYDLAGNRIGRKIIILQTGQQGNNVGSDEDTDDDIIYALDFQNDTPEGNYTDGGNPSSKPNFDNPAESIISDIPPDISENDIADNRSNTMSAGKTPSQNNEDNSNPMVDMLENRKIIIYPNPTQGLLKIEIRENIDIEQITVHVFDLLGKQTYSQKMTANPLLLDLSGQPNGTYILRITEGEQVSVWKIIKQ